MVGDKYRGRNAASHVSSRKNVSGEQRAKLGADRKRSASAGTSSRGTRSSKNENSVKRRAIRSQDPHERFLSSRKESKRNAKTSEHAPAYKARLFTDETSDVGSASNDDPIYNLRKEIRDWRAAVQLNEFERCIAEDGAKKNALREDYGQVTAANSADPDVLPGLSSSIVVDRLTRCTVPSSPTVKRP